MTVAQFLAVFAPPLIVLIGAFAIANDAANQPAPRQRKAGRHSS